MKRFNKYIILMACTACLLSLGCGKSTTVDGPAPVSDYGLDAPSAAGVMTVAANDTLYKISRRFNLPMRDIIEINGLQPPFILQIGQRLLLPPPQQYRVTENDTLYGISRLFGINMRDLARLNNLSAPYTISTGQILSLPNFTGAPREVVSNETRPTSAPPKQENEMKIAAAPTTGVTSSVLAAPTARPIPKAPSLPRAKVPPPPKGTGKFSWPVKGEIISSFGPKTDGLHNDGINIAAKRGTPVKSVENGVVAYTGNALKGYGNLVLIRHDNGWVTAYGHLGQIDVVRGQTLRRGDVIGTVGNSGTVTRPQLHFELRKQAEAVNPSKYL